MSELFFYLILPFLSFLTSLQPQPLLQPHISHQFANTRGPPHFSCSLGILDPLRAPWGVLLPVTRRVRPLLLASPSHSLRPGLPLYSAEV